MQLILSPFISSKAATITLDSFLLFNLYTFLELMRSLDRGGDFQYIAKLWDLIIPQDFYLTTCHVLLELMRRHGQSSRQKNNSHKAD